VAKPVVGIEAADFAALQRDLKKANGDALKLFRTAAKAGGDKVASKARATISGVSQRIADSIKVYANNKGVQVRAGGAKAPHAAAFENLGKEGTFRHPVFGNRQVWVSQEAHPFLLPALTDDVLDEVAEAFLDALTGEAGFH
jgi:bacteriophage HK97-gp10 putative tail-component